MHLLSRELKRRAATGGQTTDIFYERVTRNHAVGLHIPYKTALKTFEKGTVPVPVQIHIATTFRACLEEKHLGYLHSLIIRGPVNLSPDLITLTL